MTTKLTLDRFTNLQRKTDPEQILQPIPDFDIEDINKAILSSLYFACKADPEKAVRQYNISLRLANTISKARMEDLSELARQSVLIFKPACDDIVMCNIIEKQAEQKDVFSPIRLLAANFSRAGIA